MTGPLPRVPELAAPPPGDPRIAVVDRLLAAIPPPPTTDDAELLLAAFAEMCRGYDEVVGALPATIAMGRPRPVELETKMEQLATRHRAWATAIADARGRLAVHLGAVGKLRRYAP